MKKFRLETAKRQLLLTKKYPQYLTPLPYRQEARIITLLLTSHEEDDAARLTGSLEMIDRLQHETDEVKHELDLHLDKLLTSPMDREDIHLSSTRLRLVGDFIVVCERIELFGYEFGAAAPTTPPAPRLTAR